MNVLDTNFGQWVVETEEDPSKQVNGPAYSDDPRAVSTAVHVIPKNDLFPHVLSLHECWCKPHLDDEDGPVVVHNSADGREYYETGARRLN